MAMKKWTNELNRSFPNEQVQMGKNHMQKCSKFLVMKEMQIKNHVKSPSHSF
jgi:hypothetical protein